MGTEKNTKYIDCCRHDVQRVKLNNPLMGTEN